MASRQRIVSRKARIEPTGGRFSKRRGNIDIEGARRSTLLPLIYFPARLYSSPVPQPALWHYGARGNEVATRRFQGSRTGVRLIPPVTSAGEEGMRCRETGSTTQGSKVEGGNCRQEEVEPEGQRAKGGWRRWNGAGPGVDCKKGSTRVALPGEGFETFRSVRYGVFHRGSACHDFRALIKEIRKGEINFCCPTPFSSSGWPGQETPREKETGLYCC